MKILVAEDDLASSAFLVQFLTQYGEVDRAVDGLEALEAYSLCRQELRPYDIIFLDIMMPKVDGVTVLKAIRNYETKKRVKPENKTKVVLTSALTETDYVKKAREVGYEGCLSKPLDTQELQNIMQQLI